jgi:hypothetical protein
VSRGPGVWSRTGRLEATLQQVARRRAVAVQEEALREAAERVAAEEGLEPAEVLAEAQALVARAEAAGARTEAEVIAFLAREQGLTLEELQAELAPVEAEL